MLSTKLEFYANMPSDLHFTQRVDEFLPTLAICFEQFEKCLLKEVSAQCRYAVTNSVAVVAPKGPAFNKGVNK
jgi:hypothetical protein